MRTRLAPLIVVKQEPQDDGVTVDSPSVNGFVHFAQELNNSSAYQILSDSNNNHLPNELNHKHSENGHRFNQAVFLNGHCPLSQDQDRNNNNCTTNGDSWFYDKSAIHQQIKVEAEESEQNQTST